MKTSSSAMLILVLCSRAAMIVISLTVKVQDKSSYDDLQPILVCNDGRPAPSTTGSQFRIESDRLCFLHFAAGCSSDAAGRPVNCHTGGCGSRSCNLDNWPVAATMIVFNNGTVKTILDYGYNFPLNCLFEDIACKSFSCVIPQEDWPETSMVYDSKRLPVGCTAGIEPPAGQDCLVLGSYSGDPSAGFTCPNDNVILTIQVVK